MVDDRGTQTENVSSFRVAVPSRPPPDVSPGYPAVPERPQDIVQHPAGAAVLYLHCCVAHRRRYHPPGKYKSAAWNSLFESISFCYGTMATMRVIWLITDVDQVSKQINPVVIQRSDILSLWHIFFSFARVVLFFHSTISIYNKRLSRYLCFASLHIFGFCAFIGKVVYWWLSLKYMVNIHNLFLWVGVYILPQVIHYEIN